jgi:predicted phage terminase large subunit-like protein
LTGSPALPPTPKPTSAFVQGDTTWSALRKRALTDLFFFNNFVLGYGPKIPMTEREHLMLCRFAEKRTGHVALDTARYRKIEIPREVGKSSCVTKGYTIQRICQNPNIAVLIANEKEQNAKDFLSEIKAQFESNDLLRTLFPEVIPRDFNDTTWSASRIIVNRSESRDSPTVSVIGEGGTVTGMRYDLIIADDILSREAAENARTGDGGVMHRINRWVHQLDLLLNSNAQPFAEIIVIGTRWYYGDTYEHIEEAFGYGAERQYFSLRARLSDGSTQQLPPTACYRVGDLAVLRRSGLEDGQVAFPSKWPMERMTKLRMTDPLLFAANVMNDPSNEAVATFRESWLKRYNWIDDRAVHFVGSDGKKRVMRPDDMDVQIFVDPGGFGTRVGEDRARAAIVVVGATGNGEYLILDIYSERGTYLQAINELISFCSRYSPRKLVIEQAGQQAAFIEIVRRDLEKAGLNISIQAEKPGMKAKENRILELEPFFQKGQIYISSAACFQEFLEQFRQFPRGARVDILDALAYLPKFVKRQSSSQQNVEQRRALELAAYWGRRSGR